MIKLIHERLNEPIVFEESICALVVEKKEEFTRIVEEIRIQQQTGLGNFVLSDNEKTIDFSKKSDLMIDYFSLSLSDKKIINSLYKKIQSDYFSSGDETLMAEINKIAFSLLDKIVVDSEFDLTYEKEMSFTEILKECGVRIVEDYDCLLDKIVTYIDTKIALDGIKLFITVNLSAFLSEEQMKELKKHCDYNRIHILLIENSIGENLPADKITVIDKDLCRFCIAKSDMKCYN